MIYEPKEPEKTLELTAFDLLNLESLDKGDKMETENKIFKISRDSNGYNIKYGNTSVTLPTLFCVKGYFEV